MKELYLDGRLFNGAEEELLTIEKFDYKEWFQNGKPHRDDGPARIFSNGYHAWLKNGYYHRIDGPAVIHSDGFKEWRMEGALYHIFFNKFFPVRNFARFRFPGE